MAILDILHFPDPRLRNKAQPVAEVDAAVRRLVADMLETMYQAPGIGLAATQVNVAKQVIVIDISEQKDQPLCLINPRIIERAGEERMEEGCLSVPGIFEPAPAPQGSGSRPSTGRESASNWRRTIFWRSVFNTKSITWMVSCSSIISPV